MNNKGFTLIELIATMTLLAILMLIAVPNIIGIVNRNKNKTYVEDAKKMVSLAEYRIRSNSANKPSIGNTKVFNLNELGKEDFKSAPNGGCYDLQESKVEATVIDSKIKYYVTLIERDCTNGSIKGAIEREDSEYLYTKKAAELVKTNSFSSSSSVVYAIGDPTNSSVQTYSSYDEILAINSWQGFISLQGTTKRLCVNFSNSGNFDVRCVDYNDYANEVVNLESTCPGHIEKIDNSYFSCYLGERQLYLYVNGNVSYSERGGSSCEINSSGAVNCTKRS